MAVKGSSEGPLRKNLTGPEVDINSVASTTDYTGLIPTPPQSSEEIWSYYEIYDRPRPENVSGAYDGGPRLK